VTFLQGHIHIDCVCEQGASEQPDCQPWRSFVCDLVPVCCVFSNMFYTKYADKVISSNFHISRRFTFQSWSGSKGL